MLAMQMAAVHNAIMEAASALQKSTTLMQQQAAACMLQKFLRAFATQVEAAAL
jgi:hypothetical protein